MCLIEHNLNHHKLNIQSQTFYLNPYKAIYWKEQSSLILSDLHLGKAGHFRKNGIPISSRVHENDFLRLKKLISFYNPVKIIIVGDLFHSSFNSEWQIFEAFVRSYPQIDFFLIKGNHDVLEDNIYLKTLHCFESFEVGPFCFVHKPEKLPNGLFSICGHIHPSILIKAQGRQNLKISCFYFTDKYAVLPSFGNFTGNYKISFKLGDLVYLIVDDQVVPYNPAFHNE